MNKANKITITEARGADGWVKGTIREYHFEAKVFDEGSQYGIFEGKVSKLSIWDPQGRIAKKNFLGTCIISYDRDWDLLPADEDEIDMVDDLVIYLEALAAAECSQEIDQGESR